MIHLLAKLKRRARPWVCPFERVLAPVPTGASLFDIGCGGGFLLGLVANLKAPARLAGAEISATLVSSAEEYLRQEAPHVPATIYLYDGRALPESMGSFNVVTLVDVLHHVPEGRQRQFLQAIHDAMAAGATLILKDIDAGRPVLCLANKLHDLLASGSPGHELRKEAAAALLRSAGFEIKSSWSVRHLWYPHYCFVCEKKLRV